MCDFAINLSTLPGQKITFRFHFAYILYHLSSTTANLDFLCSAAAVCSVVDHHNLSEIKLIFKDILMCVGGAIEMARAR